MEWRNQRASASGCRGDSRILKIQADKSDNKTPRIADDRFFSFSLIIFFVIVESILNGIFFSSGSDLGFLGGVLLALALSAINVATGALNGFAFLRSRNSRRWIVSIPSGLAFLVIEGAVIVFNGFIAHYRDIYQTAGDATRMTEVWLRLGRVDGFNQHQPARKTDDG